MTISMYNIISPLNVLKYQKYKTNNFFKINNSKFIRYEDNFVSYKHELKSKEKDLNYVIMHFKELMDEYDIINRYL